METMSSKNRKLILVFLKSKIKKINTNNFSHYETFKVLPVTLLAQQIENNIRTTKLVNK